MYTFVYAAYFKDVPEESSFFVDFKWSYLNEFTPDFDEPNGK